MCSFPIFTKDEMFFFSFKIFMVFLIMSCKTKQRGKFNSYKETFCELKYNINRIKVCKNSTK